MDENSTNKVNETNINNETNEEIKRGGEYPTRAVEQLTPGVVKFDPNMRAVYAGPQILTPADQTPDPRMKPSFEIPPMDPMMYQQLQPATMLVYAGPEVMSGMRSGAMSSGMSFGAMGGMNPEATNEEEKRTGEE